MVDYIGGLLQVLTSLLELVNEFLLLLGEHVTARGLISSLEYLLSSLVSWLLIFGREIINITLVNETAGVAFDNFTNSLGTNLPNITGPPDASYGISYILGSMINYAATNEVGQGLIAETLASLWNLIGTLIDLLSGLLAGI